MKEYKLNQNEYLSKNVIAQLLNESKNYLLISDTNTGKTESCIKAALESGQNFVFAVDCKLLASQLGKLYKLPVYYAGQPKPKGNCITLYNHVDMFSNANAILFIDEFHSLFKDFGYKKEVIETMIQSFPKYKQVIGLTGTPIAPMQGYEEIKVSKDREERNINLINYKGRSYMDSLLYYIIKNPDKTHYISIFDKSNDAIEIQTRLLANGFKESDIANINSETKDTLAFKSLVNNRKVSNCKVVIITYTQGFNVEGENYMLHIIPKYNAWHSIADIEQVVNRFRNEIPLINLYWNHTPEYKTDFCPIKKYDEEYRESVQLINNYKNLFVLDSGSVNPAQINILKGHFIIDKIINISVDLKPSLLGINYNVYRLETAELYKDIQFMKNKLKELNYNLLLSNEEADSFNSYNSKVIEIKSTIQEFRTTKQKERLNEIYMSGMPIVASDTLSSRFKDLMNFGFSKLEAFNKLSEILLDNKKWNKLIKTLEVKHSNGFVNVLLKEKIYSIFSEERYTNDEIFNVLNDLHKSLNLPKINTKTKAAQIFNMYFDADECKVNKGDKRIKGKRILTKIAA